MKPPIETLSLGDFMNLMKSSRKAHVIIRLSGNEAVREYWPYTIRIESRLASGQAIYFEQKGKIRVANISSGWKNFVNKRILAEPVEEIVRATLMLYPSSTITVKDLYGKLRNIKEFMMHMNP
ncbi:MAG: hypothetical protein HY432_01695 [Candidatus Liptonbacteria bacterium]|nr:hypothetical protein [Candidatus Liptonbacteria bacterium]